MACGRASKSRADRCLAYGQLHVDDCIYVDLNSLYCSGARTVHILFVRLYILKMRRSYDVYIRFRLSLHIHIGPYGQDSSSTYLGMSGAVISNP